MIFNREEQQLMLEGNLLSREDVKDLLPIVQTQRRYFCVNSTVFWTIGSTILLILL